MKKYTLLPAMLLMYFASISQEVSITGQYIDKNDDAISEAAVKYFTGEGTLLGSTSSDLEGDFELTLDLTGVTTFSAAELFIQPPSPNPFNDACSFAINVEDVAVLTITDLTGKQIVKQDISKGLYKCTWGGMTDAGSPVQKGTYIITISTEAISSSYKVLFNGEPIQGLVVNKTLKNALDSFKHGLVREQDRIEFTKDNTSDLEVYLNLPSADTSMGIITGNIGPSLIDNIEGTYFSIDVPIMWNLNNYFTNDDQSIYTQSSGTFTIANDVTLVLDEEQGAYNTIVIATDPQDESLTADMSVDVMLEYTVFIPTQQIDEDSEQEILIDDLDDYKNPEYDGFLTYLLVSQSNSELINVYIDGSSVMVQSIAADEWGNSEVQIVCSDGDNSEAVYFTIEVLPKIDVSGTIRNIFDSIAIAGATVEIEEEDITHTLVSDDDGNYQVQLTGNYDEVSYLPVTIEADGYTPYHTWLTVENAIGDTLMDYTSIPIDFTWDMYNDAFRVGVPGYSELGDCTYHWLYPPLIHVYYDNSLVLIDIWQNYQNTLANLDTILPTFNPMEAIPENVVPHPEGFGYIIQDGEMGVYWDDNIGPAGTWSCNENGPVKIKCTAKFRSSVGTGSPQDRVLNQELGSVMGAVTEPPSSDNYESVFTESGIYPYYTDDDYANAHVYLNRSLLHYRNLDGYEWGDPEGWDWEQRPDTVEQWYGGDSKSKSIIFHIREFDENGIALKDAFYKRDEVPSSIMKQWPMMFTKEEINQKMMHEWLNGE